jgi:putative transcriptional regulator
MRNSLAPAHHPSDEVLLGYAAGSVAGARALIVATHLAYCPECRAQVTAAENISGEIFDRETGLTAGDMPEVPPKPDHAPMAMDADGEFNFAPRHLRAVLKTGRANWVDVWFGVKEMPLPDFGPEARLLWIPKGRRMPRHDHLGEEMTLVLKGSFSDATGRYAVGDFQTGTPGLTHQPHAGDDGPCICLVVEQGGLKLSGWLGRLVAWRGGRASSGLAA